MKVELRVVESVDSTAVVTAAMLAVSRVVMWVVVKVDQKVA